MAFDIESMGDIEDQLCFLDDLLLCTYTTRDLSLFDGKKGMA